MPAWTLTGRKDPQLVDADWQSTTRQNIEGVKIRSVDNVLGDLVLEVEALCFLTEDWPRQRVSIHHDNQSLGEWLFDNKHNHGQRTLRIPADVARHTPLRLQVRVPDAQSPGALGLGSDPRRLGLNLVSLRLRQAAPQEPAPADATGKPGGPAPTA